jgi:hypothetical protein
MQYSGDTIKQYLRNGISSFRFSPVSPAALPANNSAATAIAQQIVAAIPPSSSSSQLPAETTTSFSSISLASGANATGSVAISHNFLLGNIQVSSSARVRLYASAAARTADISRPPSVQITPGLANQLISAHNLTGLAGVPLNFPCSPSIPGFTTDGNVYWTITNTALTTQTITVTLTWLQLGSL